MRYICVIMRYLYIFIEWDRLSTQRRALQFICTILSGGSKTSATAPAYQTSKLPITLRRSSTTSFPVQLSLHSTVFGRDPSCLDPITLYLFRKYRCLPGNIATISCCTQIFTGIYFYFFSVLKNKFQWTHLNPQEVLEEVKTLKFQFPLSTMEAYMKRAGITSAYMKKPCLDPTDAQCPNTAPNKKSGQASILSSFVSFF